eukprot:SAG11_NODE_16_length_26235_cov_39.900417_21_plen_99_part_00
MDVWTVHGEPLVALVEALCVAVDLRDLAQRLARCDEVVLDRDVDLTHHIERALHQQVTGCGGDARLAVLNRNDCIRRLVRHNRCEHVGHTAAGHPPPL